MKYEITKPEINPFGGNVLIYKQLQKNQILPLIDNYLGDRSPQAQYNYSDFIFALWSTFYSGGSCIEDVHTHLKPYVGEWMNGKAPSSDSILKFMQNQAVTNERHTSESGITYNFNNNEHLNRLNLKILKHLNLVDQNIHAANTVDFDNVPLEHDKKDKKPIYDGRLGYHPGVTFINNHPAVVQNRDGNAHPSYKQVETIRESTQMLLDEDIPFKYFRADAASYQKEVIREIERAGAYFYIRANSSEALRQRYKALNNWQTIKVNGSNFEVSEVTHQLAHDHTTYRIIVTRTRRWDHQGDLFTGDDYVYRGIITNDWESDPREIVEFYNQRGTTEQGFRDLNEFGWTNLPFSRLKENTVYLITTAMGHNVLSYLKQQFSKSTGFVDAKAKLKRFIFEFVIVPVKWIKRGRQWVLKLYTHKPYHFALE